MTAFFVFNLRGIYQTIDESAHAWDERNYWKKAEALREKWRWTRTADGPPEVGVAHHRRDEVPPVLLGLVPYFNSITVTTITRNADWRCGALRALHRP